MNNQNQTKESMTEEEIIEKLKKGKNVQPPDVLLRSILNKLPNASPEKTFRALMHHLYLFFRIIAKALLLPLSF